MCDPVVIDTGSSTIKAGFGGDDAPIAVIPSCMDGKKSPIERGIITDWNDIEQLWRHTLINKLKVEPAEHAALFSDMQGNNNANREKMTQIVFEQFNVPTFCVINQTYLALYCSGRTTGVVLDSGYTVTHIVPFINGYPMPQAIMRSELAGKTLTEHLQKILSENKAYSLNTSDTRMIADIKEKLCYVAMDSNAAAKGTENYSLPDGKVIKIGNERCRCTEALFAPKGESMHKLVFDSIMKNEIEDRKDFYGNIIMNGGNTLFKGMPERLEKEIKALSNESNGVKVIAAAHGINSTFIGGSLLTLTDNFGQMSVTKAEYDEAGPYVVRKKCTC